MAETPLHCSTFFFYLLIPVLSYGTGKARYHPCSAECISHAGKVEPRPLKLVIDTQLLCRMPLLRLRNLMLGILKGTDPSHLLDFCESKIAD
jgi:hypothetical protein